MPRRTESGYRLNEMGIKGDVRLDSQITVVPREENDRHVELDIYHVEPDM